MRSVLVGAVGSTEAALRAMCLAGHPPELLVTLPIALQRRHSDFVDLRGPAAECGVPVQDVADINAPEAIVAIRLMKPDFLFVIGWSQIVRAELLAVPAVGSIGYHPTALPLDRGRAAIPWTILLGRETTASSLFWLGSDVDDGDIIDQEFFSVSPSETATTLYAKHVKATAELINRTVSRLAAGERPQKPQDHSSATWCARRSADDGLIDWKESSDRIERLVRAVAHPYPGAFTFSNGERILVWRASVREPTPVAASIGQVVSVSEGVRVRCGDGRDLLLEELSDEAGRAVSLRLHERLGLSLLDLWRRERER